MKTADLKQQGGRLSELNNPFTKSCVRKFSTHCFRTDFGGWHYRGSVGFQNGKTSGEQAFAAVDYASLLKQMELFVDSLEDS